MAWNRPQTGERNVTSSSRHMTRHHWTAGIAILLLLGIACFFFNSGTKQSGEEKSTKDHVIPVQRTISGHHAKSSDKNSGRKSSIRHESDEVLNARNSIRHDETSPSPVRSVPASDQQLAFLANLMVNPDGPPIPMFKGKDDGTATFLKSLKHPVEILPDDSDFVKDRKKRLIQLREEMKALIDEGATFNEIIKEQQSIVRENAETRRSAMRELRGILESGDRDGAEKYLRVINLAFQQMGIQEMDMPMTKEERKAKALELYKLKQAGKENYE